MDDVVGLDEMGYADGVGVFGGVEMGGLVCAGRLWY